MAIPSASTYSNRKKGLPEVAHEALTPGVPGLKPGLGASGDGS